MPGKEPESHVQLDLADYVHDVNDLTAETVERIKNLKPKTLGIRCRRAECAKDLHCFDGVGRKRPRYARGRCQYCGVDLIDWDRMWLNTLRLGKCQRAMCSC